MERIRQIRVEGRTARPGNNQMQERRAGPQKLHALFGLGTWEGGCWYHSLTQGIQEEHQLRGGEGRKYVPLWTCNTGKWRCQHWTEGPGDENLEGLYFQLKLRRRQEPQKHKQGES